MTSTGMDTAAPALLRAAAPLLRHAVALVLLGAAAVLLSTCGDPTAPDLGEDALLRTDRGEYLLDATGRGITTEIPFTYHNTTDRTLYLVNCGGYVPPVLEKWEDGHWVSAWAPVELLCLSLPVGIAPGEIYRDTLEVLGFGYGSDAYPQFQTPNLEGVYRLDWPRALYDYDFDNAPSGSPVPERYRVSNSFRLRFP